jgi:hypothetical protein
VTGERALRLILGGWEHLTGNLIRVTATGKQPLLLALDVSAYDEATLQLGVLSLDGSTPSVTVRILTSMHNETEEGWVLAGAFTAQTSAPSFDKLEIKELLKYIRWEVIAFQGGGSATFSICGMLRKWS